MKFEGYHLPDVEEGLPVKQGLKQEFGLTLFCGAQVEEGLPVKQGLKLTSFSSSFKSFHQVEEGLPVKQGLKLSVSSPESS